LDVLKKANPTQTHFEDNYPFVECAVFADKVKGMGGSY
jgi:hypothetical protein